MKISIIGTGTMGRSMVDLMLDESREIIWVARETDNKKIEDLNRVINRAIRRGRKMGSITDSFCPEAVRITTRISDVAGSDFVFEAISESLESKHTLLRSLGEVLDPTTIVATNTSSLSIEWLAQEYRFLQSFLGVHFFNPATVMELVEVVSHPNTLEITKSRAVEFLTSLGKSPVFVKNSPGFIVNRLLMPLINEAASALDDGVASEEEIDKAMKLGANHPIGPLHLADVIGIDIVVDILKSMHMETGKNRFLPHQRLLNLVASNRLGRKTKQGFYKY